MLVMKNELVMELNLASRSVATGFHMVAHSGRSRRIGLVNSSMSRCAFPAQRAINMSAQGNALGLQSRVIVEP